MSDLALRPLVARGNTPDKLSTLADHLEYCTGQNREFPLVGNMRHIPTLLNFLQKCNLQRGRRARDKKIPIDFPNQGLFALEEDEDGGMWVEPRGVDIRYKVPSDARICFADGTPIPTSELFISSKYSEKYATISLGVVGD